jgi:hypothetical protein
MPNQVTLTFAGETKDLESSFDRVGSSARHMGDRVGESAGGFDRAGEAADGAEGKAQGFSDTLTGVADIGAGTGEIMKGNLFEGFVTAGQGVADLAGGMAEFLIPALKASKVGVLAKAAADKVAAGAARVWAAAQWVMNSALFASPITWIVAGIVLLIAAIVLIATKTDWFQKAWRAAWGWIKTAAANTWEFIKKIPGWIASAFSKVAGFISRPFKDAFNAIASAWNNTIGRLHWSVPSWVPGIGGKGIDVPNLPHFHAGGIVPGVPGTPTVALLQAGETIGSVATSGDSGGGWVAINGDAVIDSLTQAIASRVGARGGRAAQLGIRFA